MAVLLNLLDRTADLMTRLCRFLLVAVFVIMGVAVMAQIVLRAFGHSFIMMEDVAIFGFFWLVFTGMAVAFREDIHVKVEFFVELFPDRAKRFLHIVTQLLVILFLGLFTLSGVIFTLDNVPQHGMQLRISMAWVYFILPVASFSAMAAVSAALAAELLGQNKEGKGQ